ncbi:arylesterase [Alteromonas sp. D210916BOD_24]|uniref:arylesterase n=1 Tax=Alteromonas sp. D210916BOD_24 TaxID=3157618 RepID=UPI00399CBF3F
MFVRFRQLFAFFVILLIPVQALSDQAVEDRKANNAVLLILGDSLSAAYGLQQREGWVSLLQKMWLNDNIPIEIVNAAVSGETTDGGLARFPRLLEQHSPTHVLIELGGNDGLQGHNIKKIKDNLRSLVETAKKANTTVFLQEMQIPSNYGRRYTEMFTRSFTEVAEEQNVQKIPFFLSEIALKNELMQNDGIHPNAIAQPQIASIMDRHLRELILKPQ